MTDVTLIQCTDGKYDTTAKAGDIYEASPYYRAMRRWAKARGDPWFILSAKHGLLDPETVIEPYDERGLNEQQAEEIATELADRGFNTAHVTAGRDYTDPLVPALERQGVSVVNHFAGCRIGERRRELRQATRELENESLC